MQSTESPKLGRVDTVRVSRRSVVMSDHQFETIAASNDWSHGQSPAPVSVPIYASSTFVLQNADHGARLCAGEEQGYLYTRWKNPTVESAAQVLNDLEGGEGTLLFSSGMAAISTALMALLRTGDHVVAPKVEYSGTHYLLQQILPRYGIEVTFVDARNIEAYRTAVKPNTKVLYGETPCNPLMNILDLEEFGRLGKSLKIPTVVDSTFASPFIQNPIRHGVDVVLHSCSKYLGGHSDIIAGAVTASTKEILLQIFEYQKILGSCLSPFDAFLLLRGIRTLHVRMERHSANAMDLALFLENHPKVGQVFYPGLTNHPGHEIAKRQMKGFGGMLAFTVKGSLQDTKTFSESLKLFKLAVSLGGTDSLVEVVSLMTHTDKYVTPKEKQDAGITDNLIRLSVGLENAEDLKKDIEQALCGLS